MKILILDDIQYRLDVIAARYPNDDVVTCTNYSDCIKLLRDNKFDLIHLDHDLDEFQDNPDTYIDGWGKVRFYNGYDVVKFILGQLNQDNRPKQAIIHSINVKGRIMADDLNRNGVPAVWDLFKD